MNIVKDYMRERRKEREREIDKINCLPVDSLPALWSVQKTGSSDFSQVRVHHCQPHGGRIQLCMPIVTMK